MASPVILILGAGKGVGKGVASAFASKGYKVALAARSLKEAESTPEQLNIKSDFANPDDVVYAFTRTKKELGVPPSVVLYNGKSRSPPTPSTPSPKRVCQAASEYVANGMVQPVPSRDPRRLMTPSTSPWQDLTRT
jgi:NAD(P)-dependent dehydrogenase (short-subunit alcohol dehydrogenase family)